MRDSRQKAVLIITLKPDYPIFSPVMWFLFPQSRHCTNWFGRHGPEPHHEHEWPRLCGKLMPPVCVAATPCITCSTFLSLIQYLSNRSALTTVPCPRCMTSCRMRLRAPRWLEQNLWKTWWPSSRSPGGSSCWSRLDRLWMTSLTSWWAVSPELG